MKKLLAFNPEHRYNAREALRHSFFQPPKPPQKAEKKKPPPRIEIDDPETWKREQREKQRRENEEEKRRAELEKEESVSRFAKKSFAKDLDFIPKTDENKMMFDMDKKTQLKDGRAFNAKLLSKKAPEPKLLAGLSKDIGN